MRITLNVLSALLVICCAAPSAGQIAAPNRDPIVGARRPAISPDGSKIAFQYRGDIWVAPSEGGIAQRITAHLELETAPVWSPDGKWIAFSSDRNGNYDVFAIPSEGGETRQITYSGFGEIATDWSPDGRWVVFSGRRDTPWTGIFLVDVRTLRFKMIAQDYQGLSNPKFSPDGKSVVAQRYGFSWTRPRYNGSAASQLVLVDFETGAARTLRSNEKQHLWPIFHPNGKWVYAVTCGDTTPSVTNMGKQFVKWPDTPDRTPNLWRFELNGHGRRVTDFVGQPVRTPSISSDGTISFEKEGHLFTWKDGNLRQVDIYLFGDPKTNAKERQVLTGGASEAAVSPDEKSFAFAAGAEIWTAPIEKPEGRNKDDARRLTDYPGLDQAIVWSKDGKRIFFVSDRDFSQRLFAMDVESKKVTPVWKRDDDVTDPKLSPDGRFVAFWAAGSNGGLFVWDTAGKAEPKKLFDQPGSHFFGTSAGDFAWSHDSRWVALTARREAGIWDVWIANVDSADAKKITNRNVSYRALAWSPDGKYLYFYKTGSDEGYYILPLRAENEAPGEIKLKYGKEKDKPKDDTKEEPKEGRKEPEKEAAKEEPKEPVKVEIDFKGIESRARRLFGEAVDGNVHTDPATGKIYFLQGGSLWSVNYDGKEVKKLVDGVQQFSLSANGKTAFALKEGMPATIKLSESNKVETVAFRAELVQDSNEVRKAAFTQFWRMYNRGFYDPNFHGRDWAAIRARYEGQLPGVGHRHEFSELLNMMVGELEASHSEVGSAAGGVGGPSVAHPGFMFDYSYEGPGIRVKGLFDKAPGTYEKTAIKPGDYVLAINGVDVTLDEKLWETLHDESGRDLVFTVNAKPTKEGAREVKYGALSTGDFSGLRYDQWVEGNRKRVEDATKGKVGYLHIRGMGGGDQRRFEEEFWDFARGKEAMIVDVRFNGGGNISDTLIDWLERAPHGYYKVRDSFIEVAPFNRVWNKPTVVLHNEHSYSNAEMFPYAMRARRIATLIGMPTPGYVIWTWGGRLVDGTGIRMPMGAVYRMDGTPMENIGQQPDIRVPWSNEEYMAGKDPQLDRAIEEMAKEIAGKG